MIPNNHPNSGSDNGANLNNDEICPDSYIPAAKIRRLYRGDLDGVLRVVNTVDQQEGSQPLRHIVYYSPTGFAWGYEGSGSADLALSILCDVFGEFPTLKKLFYGRFKAAPYYQAFKREFVARWDFQGSFEIDSNDVIRWLRAQGAEV